MPLFASSFDIDSATVVAGAVALLIGVAGVVAGRRARREFGPDARMHYPMWGLYGWIQRSQDPDLTAQQVVRIGWAFVVAGLIVPIPFNWWAWTRRANSACIHLVTEAELQQATGLRTLERSSLVDHGDRCWASYGYRRNPDDILRSVATVSIRPATFPGTFLGQSAIQRVAKDLEHQGFALEALPALGDDAFVARKNRDVIVFETHGVPVEIEIEEREVETVDVVAAVVQRVAERSALVRPYAQK